MNYNFFQEVVSFFPELYLSVSLCFFLLFCSLFSTFNYSLIKKTLIFRKICFWVSLQLLFYTLILTINSSSDFSILFFGCLVNDYISLVGKVLILSITLCVFLSSYSYIKNQNLISFEFFIVLLISTLALILIVDSTDLVAFYLALELQALSFYILATFKKESAFSTEAGLKYFIMGAFSSGFFLFGCSLIYGFAGTTNYYILKDLFLFDNSVAENFTFVYIGFAFLIVSFLFKLGAAPFHIWIPDVYEGSPTIVSIFFACVPKLALLVGLSRLLFMCFFSFSFFWQSFCLFVALSCFFVGSFGALAQRKIKRFLAFSSIGHLGFILLGVSSSSLIGLQASYFYLILYMLIALSSWLVVISFSFSKKINLRFLDELESLWYENAAISFFFDCIVFFNSRSSAIGWFFY
jgi:NADH-quinone oxidoreductase subunit N